MTFNERFSNITNDDLYKIKNQMLEIAKSRDYETLNYVKGAFFGFEFTRGISKRFERKFLEELYNRTGLDELPHERIHDDE